MFCLSILGDNEESSLDVEVDCIVSGEADEMELVIPLHLTSMALLLPVFGCCRHPLTTHDHTGIMNSKLVRMLLPGFLSLAAAFRSIALSCRPNGVRVVDSGSSHMIVSKIKPCMS